MSEFGRAVVERMTKLEKEKMESRRVEIQRRDQHAWSHSASTIFALPVLRGFWPFSAAGVAGQAIDLQGLGNHLTRNGDPQYSYANLIPHCQFDGTGDYFNITDAASGNAFDILGTEVYVETAERGLTVGGWFYPEETGTFEIVMNKGAGAGTRSYRIYFNSNDTWNFELSDDGTNTDTATSAVVSVNSWYHVVGRFIPSTSVDIFVNAVETNQATARAAAFNTAQDFTIGANSAGGSEFQGRCSMTFICAAQLSDTIIQALYYQTRAMYGV